jgi:DNA-binding transcriptional MerR regulator
MRIIDIMKPEQLARKLGITSATLRNWARKDFTEFLSPNAQGENGSKRSFNDEDVRILAWVAALRGQNTANDKIKAILKSARAEDWKHLPELPPDEEPTGDMIPREVVEVRLSGMQEQYNLRVQALARERDEAVNRLEAVQKELASTRSETNMLRQKLMEVTDQVMNLNRELTAMLQRERRK